uniref:Uncharacterized protein n=1 Tax=Euplotes harpa TaxID=151035 RepID=A0A7S3JGW4_9SPIT|mmetsp:Transcript_3628/g.4444  ORF Transcript_3628/g.4444 Transcript_3628/m.4444 type:complete len:205 (+) Transcript_3628:461-1075(+)
MACSASIKRHEVRYDDVCQGKSVCTVDFTLSDDIVDGVLMYRLDNFYANHKNFVKSRSFSQLRGGSPASLSDCDPVEHNRDVGSPTSVTTGAALKPSAVAYPCGLVAKFRFTDSFVLADASGASVTLAEASIALAIDRRSRFGNTADKSQQWLDFEDEHFMVWMRPETFPWFDKLYAHVPSTLKAGQKYTLTISNAYDRSGVQK